MAETQDDSASAVVSRRQYRGAAMVFLAVALIFAGVYWFTPEGPLRWVMVSIVVVCLARAGWCLYRGSA